MPDESVDSIYPGRYQRRRGRNVPVTRLKNDAERKFALRAKQNGWLVSKIGWPDFLCIDRKGDLMVVEVKQAGHHALRPSQRLAMHLLCRAGIPCWKWTPTDGFERLKDVPMPTEYADFARKRSL